MSEPLSHLTLYGHLYINGSACGGARAAVHVQAVHVLAVPKTNHVFVSERKYFFLFLFRRFTFCF